MPTREEIVPGAIFRGKHRSGFRKVNSVGTEGTVFYCVLYREPGLKWSAGKYSKCSIDTFRKWCDGVVA